MLLEQIKCTSLKCLSYNDYRNYIQKLVENQSTSGKEKSQDHINYTMLNDRRMKRLEKTINVPKTIKERLSFFNGKVTWLVLVESWCGDAAQVLPVIQKIAELNEGIQLRILLRDKNEAIMDQFLTNGARAIPKLIMIDNFTQEVIGAFGPRPSAITKIVEDYKRSHGKITPEFKEDIQLWYNKDKGQTIMEDLMFLLNV
jgi:thiol-disulfide isomerase/thioredoxin